MVGCWCWFQTRVMYFIHLVLEFIYFYQHWCNPPESTTRKLSAIMSTRIRNVIISSSSRSTKFNPRVKLTQEEMNNGCIIGLDTWADTSCMGRHAHVREFVEGQTVSASGFASSLPSIEDIPIAHCSLAYDDNNGKTTILEINNALYLGEYMDHCLLCPNQCEENGIRIDLRPRFHYPESPTASTLASHENNFEVPLLHKGPMPYFNVRRPTKRELETCDVIQLTSVHEWDPYQMTQHLSPIVSQMTKTATISTLESSCDISDQLLHVDLYNRLVSCICVDDSYISSTTRQVSAIATRKRDKLTPEQLMKMWHIGFATAKRTLTSTTHQCLRSLDDIRRRFRTDKAHMRYRRLTNSRHGKFYVDTLFSKVKSIRGYTCGNLFTNTLGFKKFFPLRTESEGKRNMADFVQMVGIPPSIHSDDAKVFKHGTFKKDCMKFQIPQTFTEPYSPWQNRAESGIRELKSYANKLMQRVQAPLRLWCFAYEYSSDVLSLCAPALYPLMTRTPYEHVMNYTPDISEYVSFEWYQWSWYWDEILKEKVLCRWLGVAHSIGQSLCYYVLKSNGEFIARSTVIPVPVEDIQSGELRSQMAEFTTKLHSVIGDHERAVVGNNEQFDKSDLGDSCLFTPPGEEDITYPWDERWDDVAMQDETSSTQRDLDTYIGAQVVLPGEDGHEVLCRVKGRKRTADGRLIGDFNPNPILDTRVFEVEYPNGRIEALSTNLIAESLYANVDDEGFDTGLLEEIVEHERTSEAIPIEEGRTEQHSCCHYKRMED